MTDAIEIQPIGKPVRGSIRPPGSKSITNRALICAALADGDSRLEGVLDSEDTRVMIDSLKRLGIYVAVGIEDAAGQVHVRGCGGRIPAAGAELFVANSGTSMRFLTPMTALGEGTFRLDGAERMRQRPIDDLLAGLARLGVRAESELKSGCPPVVVSASGLPGGKAKIRGDVSSQFLSGLLLAAPYAKQPVEISVEGPLVSQPYIRLTLAVMRSFGIDIADDDFSHFVIPQGHYQGAYHESGKYVVEPDASAASYFFAAAAITGGEVTVKGLSRDTLQGDVAFCECLEKMGCTLLEDAGNGNRSLTIIGPKSGEKLRGVEVNMNAISDTVQTLAAVALFAEGPTTIAGVGHIRHKETDRIGNLAIELRKFGAQVDELSDGLRITPSNLEQLRGARIETYNDHRMAMSLALVGLRVPGVVILDPKCVEKTYPNFFLDLESLVKSSR